MVCSPVVVLTMLAMLSSPSLHMKNLRGKYKTKQDGKKLVESNQNKAKMDVWDVASVGWAVRFLHPKPLPTSTTALSPMLTPRVLPQIEKNHNQNIIQAWDIASIGQAVRFL